MVELKQVYLLVGKTKQKEIDLTINGSIYKAIGFQLGKAFDDKDGPWILFQSTTSGTYKWVHETDDKNYFIEELE